MSRKIGGGGKNYSPTKQESTYFRVSLVQVPGSGPCRLPALFALFTHYPQFRVSFNNNPIYPGEYSLVSDTYVIGASGQPVCDVTSAPTLTISSAPGTAPVQFGGG